MDFEKLYRKYKDGTATEDERQLVETEIRKAKEINSLLEEKTDIISKYADPEKVKAAIKKFNIRQTLRTAFIVVMVVGILAVVGIGTVFGVAFYNANISETVTELQAIENAKACAAEYMDSENDRFIVDDVDKELRFELRLTDSRYIYEIELSDTQGEYTVEVNGASGYAMITDIDTRDGSRRIGFPGGKAGFETKFD